MYHSKSQPLLDCNLYIFKNKKHKHFPLYHLLERCQYLKKNKSGKLVLEYTKLMFLKRKGFKVDHLFFRNTILFSHL